MNKVTCRIYCVHVINLSGWKAILQVSCCAPRAAFAEQMASTGAPETGGKLGSRSQYRYNCPGYVQPCCQLSESPGL